MSRTKSGQLGRDRDAHDRAEPAAAHALLDGLEQVLGLELLDGDLGVARHAERMRLDHLHAGEERAEVRGDELLEPDEVVRAAALLGTLISHDGPAPAAEQIGTSRGSASGIFTRAKRSSPSGVRTSTARFRLRFEMCGNGRAGSKASGVSTGKTTSSK